MCMGHSPPMLERGDTVLGAVHMRAQASDFGREKMMRLRAGLARGLERCNRISAFFGERIVARFQIGDLGFQRLKARHLLIVLRDGERQRLPGALNSTCRISHLLIKKNQRILVGNGLTNLSSVATKQGEHGLEHRHLLIERCS